MKKRFPSSLTLTHLTADNRYKFDSYDGLLSNFSPASDAAPLYNDRPSLSLSGGSLVTSLDKEDDESYTTMLAAELETSPSYTLNPSEIPEIIKSFTSKQNMSDDIMFDVIKALPLDVVASAVGTNESALMIALSAYASKNNYMAFSMRDYVSVKKYIDSLLRMGSTFIPSGLDENYFIDTCNELANSLANINSVAFSKVFYADESIPLLEITVSFIEGIDEDSYGKSINNIKYFIDRFKNNTGARVDIIWTHKEVNV